LSACPYASCLYPLSLPDALPILEFAGYPFGIANVPVNLIERAEIYSGVVPVRFGADALGGAVNLVTDGAVQDRKLGGSYEVGSRSEEHTSELQSRENLVCRLLLE